MKEESQREARISEARRAAIIPPHPPRSLTPSQPRVAAATPERVLLRLSSAGRLDAVVRCVGGFDTQL